MADMLKIVNGISQAVANSHDGAIDENGDPVLIGLKREEGVPITDKRVMDGFNVSFYGDQLCVHYHSEVFLKEVHDKKFESNVEQMIESIVSFIKKEYRKVTKESLSLKKEGEIDVRVEASSRIRSWVTAKCYYKIGNYGESIDHTVGDPDPYKITKAYKDFLSKGADDAKKPQNVTYKG